MPRVLVAEDDSEMRKLVVDALRKDGHEVLEAHDGASMLVALAEAFHLDNTLGRIDVIVSDMRMPVWSGLELLERLAEAGWKIPSILMTAFGDEETRLSAARVGAMLMDKPLSMGELRQAVNRLAGVR
jgi:two-component system response regulator (stage 0 sporulation protein F)